MIYVHPFLAVLVLPMFAIMWARCQRGLGGRHGYMKSWHGPIAQARAENKPKKQVIYLHGLPSVLDPGS